MIPVPASQCGLVQGAGTGATVAGPVLIPVLKDALELQKAGVIS
jgi:hypothetical protein